MYMKKTALLVLSLLLPVLASAHVVVKPSETGVGEWQTFNVSVPSEKESPTVSVKLLIPEGLESVAPNVKPGWNVKVVKTGEGESAVVTEIDWTGGSIPGGLRDDFFFSGHVPAEATTLKWKAYQTYGDGTVVAWDANEEDIPLNDQGERESDTMGPFSETKVINDLTAAPTEATQGERNNDENSRDEEDGPDPWTIVALIMSGVALVLCIQNSRRKPSSNIL
jgi:uncharacterized protein YcnI